MTKEELQRLCDLWKERLRLRDWEIRAEFVRARDINGCQGRVAYVLENKSAYIRIMNPIDWSGEPPNWEQNIQQTLIHELMHLHFGVFCDDMDDDGLQWKIAHQTIDILARAFDELHPYEEPAPDSEVTSP